MAKKNFLSNRLLTKNTIWNLLGNIVPLLVAIITIPILISNLGIDRFGILSLAWVIIGYFSLFDLGLGRAMTHLVAEKLGNDREDEVPVITWTGLIFMATLGFIAALVLVAISPWLVHSVLKVPPLLHQETLWSFYGLAIGMPIVVTTTGIRGVLEAKQQFGLVTIVRIPLGIFTFAGPLLVLQFSQKLDMIIAVLVFARLIAWGSYLIFVFRLYPSLRHGLTLQKTAIQSLLHFGIWMTVSNIVSPIMAYLDRLIIGMMISVAAVAYYSTPFDVVTKLLLIPGSLVGVLFPALSASFSYDTQQTKRLYSIGLRYIFFALFPFTLILVFFAKEMLTVWLGEEFALNSFYVAQILAVGVLVNGIASIPFALIQAAKRPDITAKIHLLELPLYLVAIWGLINACGICGAALAWLLRVTIDAVLLMIVASRILKNQELGITPAKVFFLSLSKRVL